MLRHRLRYDRARARHSAQGERSTQRAGRALDTARRARARHSAQCARLGATLQYNNCIVAERGATLCCDTVQPGATIQRSSTPRYGAGACDTSGHKPRYGQTRANDTAGLSAVRSACARKLGQGVHLVHPTQF